MSITLRINGQNRVTAAAPETPLLYILRNDFELNAAKCGCGRAQCGDCTVMLDGEPVRSCVTPAAAVGKRNITTLEGLGSISKLHALQQAFIDEQAAQCGYCSSGMIISAKALLDTHRSPTEEQIRNALAGNLCRCGTHTRIIRAIQRAAKALA